MNIRVTALVLVGLAASCASALNVIQEWGGHVLGQDYQIDWRPDTGDYGVRILANPHPEIPWKFEAFDADTHAPGDIDYIRIDEGVTVGGIRLSVVGSIPAHEYGARDLKAINLTTNGTGTNTIVDIKLARNLAEDGPVMARDITGNCLVGDPDDPSTGAVLNDVELDCLSGTLDCNWLQDLTVGGLCAGGPAGVVVVRQHYASTLRFLGDRDVAQVVIWGDMMGTIDLAAGAGQLRIGGLLTTAAHVAGNVTTATIHAIGPAGRLQIDQNLGGLTSNGGLGGSVVVGGNVGLLRVLVAPFTGQHYFGGNLDRFEITRDWAASVEVDGNVAGLGSYIGHGGEPPSPGTFLGELTCHGYVSGVIDIPYGTIAGAIRVDGDWLGYLDAGHLAPTPQDMTGKIEVGGNWTGGLWVNGALRNDPLVDPTGGHIRINGSFGDPFGSIFVQSMLTEQSYICVDFDGFHASDRWMPGGAVYVGSQTYTGNTPSMRIYEVTECRSDTNNDGIVWFEDAVPLQVAIDEGCGWYGIEYPGLGGSCLFHCDLGGPIEGECDGLVNALDFDYYRRRLGVCSPACGDLDSEGLAAGELAAGLLAHVPPERYAGLLNIAWINATEHPRPAARAYWHAVRQYLGE